ncbi:MAG: hypothetical protein DHS80DRAFT_32743 [Piptocephalis tieghemiana]|nr:MAG: hypothetical protein DHS80DRAFT_32743 [Piptocephalis tieghemiana]
MHLSLLLFPFLLLLLSYRTLEVMGQSGLLPLPSANPAPSPPSAPTPAATGSTPVPTSSPAPAATASPSPSPSSSPSSSPAPSSHSSSPAPSPENDHSDSTSEPRSQGSGGKGHPPPSSSDSSKLFIYIGAGVAGAIVLGIIGAYVIRKKKLRSRKDRLHRKDLIDTPDHEDDHDPHRLPTSAPYIHPVDRLTRPSPHPNPSAIHVPAHSGPNHGFPPTQRSYHPIETKPPHSTSPYHEVPHQPVPPSHITHYQQDPSYPSSQSVHPGGMERRQVSPWAGPMAHSSPSSPPPPPPPPNGHPDHQHAIFVRHS